MKAFKILSVLIVCAVLFAGCKVVVNEDQDATPTSGTVNEQNDDETKDKDKITTEEDIFDEDETGDSENTGNENDNTEKKDNTGNKDTESGNSGSTVIDDGTPSKDNEQKPEIPSLPFGNIELPMDVF